MKFPLKEIIIFLILVVVILIGMSVFFIILLESILVRAHGNWAAVSYVSLTILIANGLNVFLQRSLLVAQVFLN